MEKRWKESFHYKINGWGISFWNQLLIFIINIIIFLKHFEELSIGGGRIENELESFKLDKFPCKIKLENIFSLSL